MKKIRFTKIALIFSIIFILIARSAFSAAISLHYARNGRSDFFVGIGERFDLQIVVDPQGQAVTSFAVHLSFDENIFEISDTNPLEPGIQPVEIGKDIPISWQLLENDTHGDPGNRLQKFQVDYANALITGVEPAIRKKSIVGSITLRAIAVVEETSIVFDRTKAVSRLTQVGIGNSTVVPFAELTTAKVAVSEGLIQIKKTFPEKITFRIGETDQSLDLDDHLLVHENMIGEPRWSFTGNRNVTVEVGPETRVVTFGAKEEWFGRETIEFQAIDAKGKSVFANVVVRVTIPPQIDLPEIFTVPFKETMMIRLKDYVVDPDDPELDGTTFEIETTLPPEIVELSRNNLKISAIEPKQGIVRVKAIDADLNSSESQFKLEIPAKDLGPLISPKFPTDLTIILDDATIEPPTIELDPLVIDYDFPDAQLIWRAIGNLNVEVLIDPIKRIVNFSTSENWQGAEIVTFSVTNPMDKIANVKTKVTFRTKKGEPIFAELPEIMIAFETEQILDLKSFVTDADSVHNEMIWEISQNRLTDIEIDPDGVATIFAKSIGVDNVRFSVTDPQENTVSQTALIRIAPPAPPEFIDFLKEIRLKPDLLTDLFLLDDFVQDETTPAEEISWVASGFDDTQIVVVIGEDRTVKMRSLPAWTDGTQIVTFTATNRIGVSNSIDTEISQIFPPNVLEVEDFEIVANGETTEIPLDNYVEDRDTPKDQISWSYEPQDSPISVTISADSRSIIFEPSADFFGKQPFTITATDPDGQSDNFTFNVEIVEPPKEKTPPIFGDLPDLEFKQGETPSPIILIDFVEDLDTPKEELIFDFEPKDGPIKIEINPETSEVNFSAETDFLGAKIITFSVKDPDDLSDSKAITITVLDESGEKKTPVVQGIPNVQFQTGQSDQSIILSGFVVDLDTPKENLILDFEPKDGPIKIEINPETTAVSISAEPDFIGEVTITFTATDPDDLSGNQPITVTVLEEKVPPEVLEIPEIIVKVGDFDQSILLTEHVIDLDTPTSEITWDYAPKDGKITVQIDLKLRLVTLVPEEDFVGDQEITFTATDGDGLTDSDTITVTVVEPSTEKQPPIVEGIPNVEFESGDTDQSIFLLRHVKDPDTPIIDLNWDFEPKITPISVAIDPNTKFVTLTAEPDFIGDQELTFIATDFEDQSDSQTITVTVVEKAFEDLGPKLSRIPNVKLKQGKSDEPIRLNDYVTDPDTPKTELTWTFEPIETQVKMALDPLTEIVNFSVIDDFVGSQSVTIIVTDPEGGTDQQTITVTILADDAEPQPPQIDDLPNIKFEQNSSDETLILLTYAFDPDTLEIDLSWDFEPKDTPINVEINPETSAVKFTAKDDFIGDQEITFTATDPDGFTASQSLIVSVVGEKIDAQPPIVNPIPNIKITQGEVDNSIRLLDFVTDPDTPETEIAWSFEPTETRVQVEIDPKTRVTLTPDDDFIGTQKITFIATDTDDLTDQQTITVIVTEAEATTTNPPIIATLPKLVFTDEIVVQNIDLDFFVADLDTLNENLIWSRVEPVNLNVTINPKTHILEVRAKEGFSGNEEITLSVSDPEGNSAESVLTVEVKRPKIDHEKNRPKIDLPPIELETGTIHQISLDEHAEDLDNADDELEWNFNESENLDLEILSNRTLVIGQKSEAKNFIGLEFITLTATDPQGNIGIGLLNVNVVPIKDRVPPKMKIYVFNNPIQPNFLIVTITSDESITRIPSVKINEAEIGITKIEDQVWKGHYEIPIDLEGDLVISVEAIDPAGNSGKARRRIRRKSIAAPQREIVPRENALLPNYPNPFNPETWIPFDLDHSSYVEVLIFNSQGEIVRLFNLGWKNTGEYRSKDRAVRWDGKNDHGESVASGVYFYSIRSDYFSATRKMIVGK